MRRSTLGSDLLMPSNSRGKAVEGGVVDAGEAALHELVHGRLDDRGLDGAELVSLLVEDDEELGGVEIGQLEVVSGNAREGPLSMPATIL